MSRFIQEKPSAKTSKSKSTTRVLPKPGAYSKKDLEGSKKIYSNTGGKY